MYTFKLPSGEDVVLTELTGREEELLTDSKKMRNGTAINEVYLNCIKKIGDNDKVSMKDVLNLLTGDRTFILIKLRVITFGEIVKLNISCPACKSRLIEEINLDELEVIPYSEEREFDFMLPGAQKNIRFCYFDGNKEVRLATLTSSGKMDITIAMLMRIVSYDSGEISKAIMRQLSMSDRRVLREEMVKKDAGIDSVVTIECPDCNNKFKTKIEGETDFLFPGLD